MEFLCSICETFFQERIPGAKRALPAFYIKPITIRRTQNTKTHVHTHVYLLIYKQVHYQVLAPIF